MPFKLLQILQKSMRKNNNNVFKLSGNLALGSTNEYPSNDNFSRQPSYGVPSNSNTMKRPSGYGQAYQNTYDYNQKSGTSQARKYSRNHQQTVGSGYSTGLSYGQSSAKKIEYNQNSINKIQSMDSYNNKTQKGNSYNQRGNTYGVDKMNSYGDKMNYYGSMNNGGSYKDVIGNDNSNHQNRNYNQREENRNYNQRDQNRNYQPRQDRSRNQFKNTQPEIPQFSNPNSRIPPKNTLSKPPQHKITYQESSRNNNNYEQDYSSSKQQIKQYDPSTFVMCRQGCGRKFNPDSINKHQKICKKVFQNKRPEFNVQQQRIVAKEQKKLMKQGEIIQKKIEQKKKIQQKKQNMPKWKAESIGFRAALKVNRKGGQMTQEEKRIINQAQQAGMVKCKFCGRSFNEKAAERHIPFCETQQKKNALKKKK